MVPAPCTTHVGVSHPAPTIDRSPKRGGRIVPTGPIDTQTRYREWIKSRTRANDLDALKIYFSIRINDKWNNDLRKDHT
jgi:hypothetical protein